MGEKRGVRGLKWALDYQHGLHGRLQGQKRRPLGVPIPVPLPVTPSPHSKAS